MVNQPIIGKNKNVNKETSSKNSKQYDDQGRAKLWQQVLLLTWLFIDDIIYGIDYYWYCYGLLWTNLVAY